MSDLPQDEPTPKLNFFSPAAGKRGMTSLHYAAYCNDVQAVRYELENGAAVDARDDSGWTPLHWSIDMSQASGKPKEVVALLLANGASANSVDLSGFSVLMMACGRNNENILNQLINAGADVRHRSSKSTPLHEAASCNFHEGILILLSHGADLTQRDSEGRTPLELAIAYEFDESVSVIKKA